MPKLILFAGTPQAQEFQLKPGKNYVGRGFANDLKLEDASVSGSHALIMVEGMAVTVKDLGSTNGTRINQLPATESPLQSGQVVKLGSVELLFVADANAPTQPSVAPPPSAPAAAQIATEFIIRERSHVGVTSAPPPSPPAPMVVELKIPSAAPSVPPPPIPVMTAPVPVAQSGALRIPGAAPSAPPPPAPPPVPIITAPAPVPQIIPTIVAPAPVAAVPPEKIIIAPAPPRPPAPAMDAPRPVIQNIAPRPPTPTLAPPPQPMMATAAAEAPPPSGGSRLTLSGVTHAATPAPVLATASAPTPQPVAAPLAPGELIDAPAGMVACKFHRTTPGQWLCQKCNLLFCSLCVSNRPTPAGIGYFCRTCGTQAVQVKIKAIAKKKEKQLVAYSEGTILMRTAGFGLGATVVCGGIWAGFTAMTGFDMPAIFAPLTGVGCGYAVKIASQDRPGGFFSIVAVVATILGILVGMFGAILITGHFLFTINSLAMGVFGLLLGLFVAWKIGGGDF